MPHLGSMIGFYRRDRGEFTLVDGLILVVLMVIVSGTTVSIIEAAGRRAKVSGTLQNLRVLRARIELYKLEHHGKPPLLYEGGLPQLTSHTNEHGVPGKPGPDFSYGPYLPTGVPMNPLTNAHIVTATDVFPPVAPSGKGGWLYHEKTGQIAPDVEGYLDY